MNPNALLYFVLVDYGNAGIAFAEREISDMDRKTTVADIKSGQFTKILKVYEACEAEGIFNNVTEDILREAGAWEDEAPELTPQASRFDHVRDLLKHEVA